VKRHILRTYSWIAVFALLLPLLAACGTESPTATPVPPAATATTGTTAPAQATDTVAAPSTGASQQLPRNETLYVAGFQWQPPTNFNPLNGNPDWPSQGASWRSMKRCSPTTS
jgi:ABC-type transport system substrate-binding protein